MNIYRINDDIEYANQIGKTLSTEEIVKIKASMSLVCDDSIFDEILFWGRIEGINKDYYILKTLRFKNEFEFPKKNFYYSTEDFLFKPLPKLVPEYEQYLENINNKFLGNPEEIIFSQNPEEDEDDNNKDEEENNNNIENKPKNIKINEISRLAYVIRAIEEECCLLPLNSIKIIPNHEIRYNETFKGLTLKQGLSKDYWLHFRVPHLEEKRNLIKKENCIFIKEFLDSVKDDRPEESIVIQSNFSNDFVYLKNLNWNGFLTYHKINSDIFGNVYFGSGIKNTRLLFIIN